MPTCAVKHHNHPIVGVPSRDFVQKYLHTIPIDIWQDQRIHFAVHDRNRCISISIFLSNHRMTYRTKRLRHQQYLVAEIRPKRASSINISRMEPSPGHV